MKKKYMEHVRNALDMSKVRKICMASFEDFAEYGTLYGTNKDDHYYFKDNGSNVLAVAHLDSVVGMKFAQMLYHPRGWRIYSPSLDDRLGAYVILHMLPALGVKCDVLLTDNEESGNTTARNFATEKKYNWMFSFDRREDDVVMYDYENSEMKKRLVDAGFKVGSGSFSCIKSLDKLGCKGFNFGVGYKDYHSEYAYAEVNMLISQVAKFTRFFHQHKDRMMEHVKPAPRPVTAHGAGNGHWDDRKGMWCGHSSTTTIELSGFLTFGDVEHHKAMWAKHFYWNPTMHRWLYDETSARLQEALWGQGGLPPVEKTVEDEVKDEIQDDAASPGVSVWCRDCMQTISYEDYTILDQCPTCYGPFEVTYYGEQVN